MRTNSQRHGFTLIELLAVIAIIATLIGIILGSASFVIKLSRDKRRDTTRLVIQNAITAYRQQYFEWPITAGSLVYEGERNKDVIKLLYQDAAKNENRLKFLEEDKILTVCEGQRMTLRQARMGRREVAFPAIYIDVDGQVKYYKIEFVPEEETVRVLLDPNP